MKRTLGTVAWYAIGLAAALAVSFGLIAVIQAWGDDPVPTHDAPEAGIPVPEGWSDIVTVCDNGNRLYISRDDVEAASAISVVRNDPTC